MKTEQKKWEASQGWRTIQVGEFSDTPGLVLVFGGNEALKDPGKFAEIRGWYPKAKIITASTAGEILATAVSDDSLVLTAIEFSGTTLQFAETTISDATESEVKGAELARVLPKEGLVHAMIFSDGLFVNGTALVKGLLSELPTHVSVTGGLVGDGSRFKETLVGLDTVPEQKKLVLVGFYGSHIKIGYGSLGGWDSFGIPRTITKATGNVLFELDNKPALTLYKEYLGEMAADLPASGLLFPLSLKLATENGAEAEVVRTVLAIDEGAQSLTFAGDMPEGVIARFMKANFDRLTDGAAGAASMSIEALDSKSAELAILVSCVGRKLVLKERVEDEIEAVQEKIGSQAAIIGFYSYGEISPSTPTERQCQLHNQTMTITTFRED